MPRGQAPAVQQPMNAVQRRNAEQARKGAQVREALMEAVEAKRLDIESFLSVFGISYDLFVAGLLVFLSKQQRDQADFFVDLNIPSFIEALTRIAMNGLIPDGKEAAIAAYKDNTLGQKVAQVMFMRDGFVKVLWRTGMVKSINDQVVTKAEYEADRFQYEEGDQGFIQHRLDLMRKDTDPVVAAYCIIELVGGGVMREVVPQDELEKMAKMSRSPARQAWRHQMHRKGAIRRIMGKMPREKGIVQLLQHDDETYLPTPRAGEPGDEAPSREALFSNRPIRKKRRSVPIAEGPPGAVTLSESLEPREGDELHVSIGEDGRPTEVVVEEAGGPPFVLQAVITTKNGVQQYEPSEMGSELWYGDLRQKMKVLPEDQLRAFWVKNRGYIEEAGRNGYGEYALQLVALADEMGLIEKEGRDGPDHR